MIQTSNNTSHGRCNFVRENICVPFLLPRVLLLRLSVVLNQMALAAMERNNAKTISVVRQRLNAYAGTMHESRPASTDFAKRKS